MSKDRIWLSPPHMSGAEMKYVQEAFDSNWVAPVGPNIDGFEKELSAYLKVPYVAALSSGTAAIHLALILLGVKRDDEVIAQSFTFCGTSNPILYLGATPVLIDSEKETWNMDPTLLEEAIKKRLTKGKKPKAVIVVHLYGMPAKIEEIARICYEYEIPLIEDAAEALGSTIADRKAGDFGDLAIFSFNGNKIITTSGGGALVSKNEEWINKAQFLATQARDNTSHYEHTELGYNYRMSNVVAGIGRGQLEALDSFVAKRRSINDIYKRRLNFEGLVFHSEKNPDVKSNYWLTTALIDPAKLGVSPDDIRLSLMELNIETRPLWKPMHMQKLYAGFPYYGNGVSKELFEKGLCFPSGSGMTHEQIERVIEAIQHLITSK